MSRDWEDAGKNEQILGFKAKTKLFKLRTLGVRPLQHFRPSFCLVFDLPLRRVPMGPVSPVAKARASSLAKERRSSCLPSSSQTAPTPHPCMHIQQDRTKRQLIGSGIQSGEQVKARSRPPPPHHHHHHQAASSKQQPRPCLLAKP